MQTILVVLATSLTLSGCLSGQGEAAEPAAQAEQELAAQVPEPAEHELSRRELSVQTPELAEQQLAGLSSTQAACRALMERQRACSAAFIPALVDARVAADVPPGVGARARAGGREALVAEALDERAADSTDAAFEAVCGEIARAIAPEREALLRSSVEACLDHDACEAFVACAVPLSLERWKE